LALCVEKATAAVRPVRTASLLDVVWLVLKAAEGTIDILNMQWYCCRSSVITRNCSSLNI